MLVVGIVGWALYSGAGANAGAPLDDYTVASGDNLWDIATSHYPASEDPRVRIEEIREINGLEGYGIQPGTHLKLPSAETE